MHNFNKSLDICLKNTIMEKEKNRGGYENDQKVFK